MVRRQQMVRRFKAGDRVVVPFGLDTVDATVLRISETGRGVQVTVALEIGGLDEPYVTTMASDKVVAVTAA